MKNSQTPLNVKICRQKMLNMKRDKGKEGHLRHIIIKVSEAKQKV